MASPSNTSTHTQLEEPAPSTSASGGATMPEIVRYETPTEKLPLKGNKGYHVFLSFREKDVRKTLVDHLYEALSAVGLNVYKNNYELEKGEEIWGSLEKAIKSSQICIPIFSKGYADSCWCLKEAAAMVSSPGLTIPLFYHVNPTHVRYPESESSPYKQAFLKHYRHSDRYSSEEIEWWKRALLQICPCLQFYGHSVRYRGEEIDGWKNALRQICNRPGWTVDATGFEARIVKKVVNDLIMTFDRVPLEVAKHSFDNMALEVAEHPVGIDSVKNALIQRLNLNSVDDVVKIGIWGIGGIGKTTVAKALYNQIYADYDAASFVSNVRKKAAEQTGLTRLQKQILEELANYDGNVESVGEGISLFRDRLRGKRVLLILDDVDAVSQLDGLVGDWLAPGSRVIIISRDRHILHVAGVSSIHEMSGLDIYESLQLFSGHAFRGASPSPVYRHLSKRIVEACRGHPLSLEVIGSFLHDKQDNIDCWMEALANITFNPDIYKRLKISYNALCDEEQEIFVDIACFFIGEHKRFPILFWKSLYEKEDTDVTNLLKKSLIKIDDADVFDMHDHLRDMGRTIAETEKQGTRLWEAAHLSTIFKNTNPSRLRLKGGNPHGLKMLCGPGLRYLHLLNLSVEGTIEDMLAMLPPNLIWLGLEDCTFSIGMKSSNSRFKGNTWQLKIMQLKSCQGVDSLPNSILSLAGRQLQYLDLRGCESLNNLPDNIGYPSELQHLNLRGCRSLNNLPDNIGNLSKLQRLDLGHCKSLNSLPDTISNLSQLQHLDLAHCKSLNSLPDTIGNLSQLQHLNLGFCERLISLPDTIGNLSQLQHLNLRWCESLIWLPDSIGNLFQLQHLDLGGCECLDNLPDTIGNFLQLQHLNLILCENLSSLPDSIYSLSQLQHLDLGWCRRLEYLPDTIGNLSQLLHLNLEMCDWLNNLPGAIGNLLELQHVDLRGCGRLNYLPDTIGNLLQLQQLDLGDCRSLRRLPDTIGNLLQLQHLDLRWCVMLRTLPDTIGNLSQLQYLNLEGCTLLENLPDTIGNISQLQILDLSWCTALNSLPDTIGNLLELQNLNLRGFEVLNKFPDVIGNLQQLQFLK